MKINLTPIIDIVFLLIIFLIIVYRGIDAENFEVAIPDNCGFAQKQTDPHNPVTITTFSTPGSSVVFAIGSETIESPQNSSLQITSWLVRKINSSIQENSCKTLSLRIDRDIDYRHAQHILAAVAASNAENLELAATKLPLRR